MTHYMLFTLGLDCNFDSSHYTKEATALWFPQFSGYHVPPTCTRSLVGNWVETASLLGFPVAQLVKNLCSVRETWVGSLGWEDPLEKGTATHSSVLARRIPWTV